jgi:hypothetical protein
LPICCEALYSALSYPALIIKEQHADSDRFFIDYFEQVSTTPISSYRSSVTLGSRK